MAVTEKIIIKFEADGNEPLKQAIKQLDKATRSLLRSQAGLQDQVRKTTSTQKKQNKTTLLGVRNQRNMNDQVKKGAIAFSVFRSKLLLASFAAGLFSSTIGKLAKLLGEQEKAEKKLETALGRTSKSLLAYAAAQQKVTTFGDEEIINEMSLIAAYTDNERAIAKLTTAALDLSAAKGISLTSATDLLAKSVFSNTNALSRYGITVEGAVGHTKRLESATSSIAAIYGGQAKKQAETFLGSIAQLGTSMGDLGENIGAVFVPSILFAARGMKAFADSIDEEKVKSYGTALVTVIGLYGLYTLWTKRAALATLKFGRAMKLTGVGLVVAGLGLAIDKLNIFGGESADLAKELEKLEGELGNLNSKAGNTLALQQKLAMSALVLSNAYQKTADLESLRSINSEKLNQAMERHGVSHANMSRILAENIEFAIEYNEIMKERLDLEDKIGLAKFSQKLATTSIAYNSLAQTAQMYWNNQQAGWDREMQNLKDSDKFKRASTKGQETMVKDLEDKQRSAKQKAWKQQQFLNMSQVVMDTATAIMSIWAQVPKFDFGISAGVLTGIVSAMGATQLALISQQQMPKFARGGLVGGRPHSLGGSIIEAERGEFVMSSSAVRNIGIETMNRINEGGGAGGVNINFSGNVLSQDFIENEAIPQIKEAVRRGADLGIA